MKFYEKQVRSGGFAAVKKLVQCVIKSIVAHGRLCALYCGAAAVCISVKNSSVISQTCIPCSWTRLS